MQCTDGCIVNESLKSKAVSATTAHDKNEWFQCCSFDNAKRAKFRGSQLYPLTFCCPRNCSECPQRLSLPRASHLREFPQAKFVRPRRSLSAPGGVGDVALVLDVKAAAEHGVLVAEPLDDVFVKLALDAVELHDITGLLREPKPIELEHQVTCIGKHKKPNQTE